jgi:myosin heavy chain 9/10/11/14
MTSQGLERQLVTAQAKYRDFEDVELQYQRDRDNLVRQLETTKQQYETETLKRGQLEKSLAGQKSEVAKLKERNTKLDKDLNTALKTLKTQEWEIKQLESKQDKTIVEHVHVLEEAKRVTDRQLAEAQVELEKARVYIKSLEKVKVRLAGEAEDLQQEKERELREREKRARLQEDKTHKVLLELEKERQSKGDLDLQSRRMQSDLKAAQGQIAELTEELKSVQRSKENLEAELDRLADETDGMDSFARLQRQYEGRISELEEQLGESELARSTANRIKDHLERQHEEIRQLILQSGKGDGEFQTRLLKELQLADEALAKEMKARGKVPRSSGAHDLRPPSAFSTPTKSRVNQHNPVVFSSPSAARADASTKQISQLKQQVQVLEIQMAASERVRKHLEISLREMADELEKSDGSKQFLQDYKARLARENQRLAALLKEEGEARKAAESAHADGIQAIWGKFQKALDDEKQNYARLDESRKALVRFHSYTPHGLIAKSYHSACTTAHCSIRNRLPKSPHP